MSHARLCADAADALATVPANHRPRVLVGFDGFIDHIIDVVSTRTDSKHYTAMPTIGDLGARITAAAGRSANIELVVRTSKIGGNGPIMANALCAFSHRVTAIGLLGEGSIDPVFASLEERAEKVINLGGPGITDALEFSDGKLMLGKLTPLDRMTWDTLVREVGLPALKDLMSSTDAVATVNWTMLLGLTEIWENLAADVLPGLRQDRPLWFVDLADPAKRSLTDRKRAMAALQALNRHVDLCLGLNEAELLQVLETIGEPWQAGDNEFEQARTGCEVVRDRLGLTYVMCHLVKSAACAWSATVNRHRGADGKAGSAAANGFFEAKPKITTGAGDHFNAGFSCAILAGIHPGLAIQIGGATSGHYVRTAHSPTREEAIAFLRGFAKAASG